MSGTHGPAAGTPVASSRRAVALDAVRGLALLGTTFNTTGFGLFTRLSALAVAALTVPVFRFEAWASRVWLRRFAMGPVEWVWRRLSYRRRLPPAAKATIGGTAIALAALAIGVQGAGPADWPQWRGVDCDGRVSAPLPRDGWPARLSRRWAREVGGGYSGPVVSGDRVFVHSRQGEKEVISALRLVAGEPLWSSSYDAPFVQDPDAGPHGRGPYSTPAIADGRLFTIGVANVLSAWDTATGRLLWRRDSGREFRGRFPYFGAAASPLVWGGLCFIHLGGDDRGRPGSPADGAMVALRVADGVEAWRWTGDGPAVGASPIVATFGGRAQLIFKSRKKVVGVDARTGRELWQFAFAVSQDNTIVTPLVLGDRLLTSDNDFGFGAWQVSPTGNAWAARQVWRTREVSLFLSSPVSVGGVVVGFSHFRKGQLFALDPADGNVLWRGAARSGEHATLAGWGDYALVFGEDGRLEVHRVSRGGLRLVRRYQVSGPTAWAHPAVTGTRILVRDGTRLAAFGLGNDKP